MFDRKCRPERRPYYAYIKRHLHLALGRFAAKLGHASVRVEDVPGPGNIPNASCRIQACVSAARARIGLVPYGWCGSPPGDGSQPGTQEAFQMNRPNCKLWNQNEEEAWNRQPSR